MTEQSFSRHLLAYYVSSNGRLLQTTIKGPKPTRAAGEPKVKPLVEYTVVKHNNRSYRTRVGSTAWRKWDVEQKAANPSFVIPAGWYVNKQGDLRKTQDRISYEQEQANEYITLRYPEMGHTMVRRTFGNLTKKTKSQRNIVETETHRREQRKEAWDIFSRLTNWQTRKAKKIHVQWQSLDIPSFKYTDDYREEGEESEGAPLTELGTELSFISEYAWVEALVYYTLRRANQIKGEKQTTIHLKCRKPVEKGYFTFAFNNAQLSSREKIRENVVREVQKYHYRWLPVETSMMVVQLGDAAFAGGCNKDNDHSHNVKQFLPRCRISLNSPKSVNSNCGIMCFIKFLGLKANVIKPDAIRKKLGLPEGGIDHEDMKRIADHFKVSCEMYIHPIQHEDAYAWRYESPEEVPLQFAFT